MLERRELEQQQLEWVEALYDSLEPLEMGNQ